VIARFGTDLTGADSSVPEAIDQLVASGWVERSPG
jgi:hypothetical protein